MNETLKEHLYTLNTVCIKCRWNSNEICKNGSSQYFNMNTKYIDEDCEHYYPENEMEIFSKEDEITDSLFD